MSENVTDFGLIAALSQPVSDEMTETIRQKTGLGISYDGSVVFQRFSGREAGAQLLGVEAITSFMNDYVAAGLSIEVRSLSFFFDSWYNAADSYVQEAKAEVVDGRRQIVHGGRTGITLRQ